MMPNIRIPTSGTNAMTTAVANMAAAATQNSPASTPALNRKIIPAATYKKVSALIIAKQPDKPDAAKPAK